MVRKIQNGEYLRRYDNMMAEEREAYESRVGQWLSGHANMLMEKCEVFEARLQNVLQVSASWNDVECQAFEEGVRLLSALVGTNDTWLPDMLYVKSAKRAINQMIKNLTSDPSHKGKGGEIGRETDAVEVTAPLAHREGSGESLSFQAGAGDGAVGVGNQNSPSAQEVITSLAHREGQGESLLVPVRPKHIDQYVHLLPKKTQEHAALVQGLYRELDEAREKLNLLMNDQMANAADREAWAKKATKCDNTLRKIFDELDAEWAKLVKSGRVVVDDLGNARVMDDVRGMMEDDSVISHQPSAITSEQKARRRELRRWLIDTRRGNGNTREEYVRKWCANFREYLTLDGDKAFDDEKIKEAIKHYEIDVDLIKLKIENKS